MGRQLISWAIFSIALTSILNDVEAQIRAPGTLMFTRENKTQANSSPPVIPLLRLKLTTDANNYDDIAIGFSENASGKYNPNEDSEYLPGINALEGLSSFSSDSVRLTINLLPLPQIKPLKIRLDVEGRHTGTYKLERTELATFPAIYEFWLMDKYKKDSLDIRSNTSYIFDINKADTASYGSNRFQVVVRQDTALMVHLLNFTASKITMGSQVVWITENEADYTNFTVEKSTDGGTTFAILGSYPSNTQGIYSFLDRDPKQGANLYRLKIADLNGTITYSNVVTLMYGNVTSLVKTGILVYPNPANGTMNLSIAAGFNPVGSAVSVPDPVKDMSYDIRIASILGLTMEKTTINQQCWQTDVSALMPGTYIITVSNSKDKSIVGQAKFIKL